MSISAGLVGLPNVGKSTLFNTLTQSSVPAENYPFCTIEPHVAMTTVPDVRMNHLQDWYKSTKLIPATMKFVDIAGLVKGAASGAGLGNQFLSHIREVDLIIHVARCFEDPHITRVETVDPVGDIETIIAELMLRDIESITKRQAKLTLLIKGAKQKPQEVAALERESVVLTEILAALNGNDFDMVQRLGEDPHIPKDLLLATKKYLIVANVGDTECSPDALQAQTHLQSIIRRYGKERVIPIAVRFEHELSLLSAEEANEMANFIGRTTSGITMLIQAAYQELGLISFFTCGPKEIHAWSTRKGDTVRTAAGHIHSDLERGFICAEVFNYKDISTAHNEAQLRAAGKIRVEGQDYILQDGDIIHVRHAT